jgi:DNA (cytosine-5)-methyltransferase 1
LDFAKHGEGGRAISTDAPVFIDVFAGCGGLSLGLLQSGWRGLLAIEKDENAFQTLSSNLIGETGRFVFDWPNWLPKKRHSLERVLVRYRSELESLRGNVDLLVGGPPCQGFSTAGRRDRNDPRNKLVANYLRLVNVVNPKFVLIENVRGITADFQESRSVTGTINYAQWIEAALERRYRVYTRILDLSKFGIPQKRHRYFIIAVRNDLTGLKGIDPFGDLEKHRHAFLVQKNILTLPVSAKSALSDLEVGRNGRLDSRDSKGFEDIAYDRPRTKYQKLMRENAMGAPTDTRLARHNDEIARRFEKLIKLCHSDGRLNVSISPEVRASFGLKKRALRVLDPDQPAPTITSMPDDLIHYCEPRTLTVRENARLQGFPDWFVFKGKYTTGGDRRRKEVPRFTQVANAVPPLVAEAIGQVLKGYAARG